jgi:flagella basal body P-ring formation protein FlgA
MAKINLLHKIAVFLVLSIGTHCEASEESPSRLIVFSMFKDATVESGRIYLSDVGRCKGDADLCREAAGVDIGLSPAAGRSILVSKSMVASVLEREWPDLNVSFDDYENCRVVGGSAQVPSEDIRLQLQTWINERIAAPDSIKITVSKIVVPFGSGIRPSQTTVEFPDLVDLPFNQIEWLAKNLSGARLTQFKFTNPLDKSDSQLAHGQAYFILQKKVPVTASALSAGTVIDSQHLEMQWYTIRRGSYEILELPTAIKGKRLRQNLASGEIFTPRMVDEAKIVTRNQPVNLIIKNGDVEISGRATTIDAGAKGQIVEVVNVANKKRLRARIVDEQTVEAVAF